jgi:hypothetical protein
LWKSFRVQKLFGVVGYEKGLWIRLRSLLRSRRKTCAPFGVDLISDALPFGALWYGEPNAIANAISYAKFYSCSHDAVIRVFDQAGNVIETHEQASKFKEPLALHA